MVAKHQILLLYDSNIEKIKRLFLVIYKTYIYKNTLHLGTNIEI